MIEDRTGGHGSKRFILLPEKEIFSYKVSPDLSGREKLGKHHPVTEGNNGDLKCLKISTYH
jgi:hypothetical protein